MIVFLLFLSQFQIRCGLHVRFAPLLCRVLSSIIENTILTTQGMALRTYFHLYPLTYICYYQSMKALNLKWLQPVGDNQTCQTKPSI